jgi:inorganic pyrophosphatase
MAKRKGTKGARLDHLPTTDADSGTLNVIIETPKGSRNKFKFDEHQRLFLLSSVLPVGASFPFDFGFVPSTLGEDGDPLDVLVLMDEPAFPGCLVPARLIGVIEAEQTDEGETERNDRLIAVADDSHTHRDVRSLGQLSTNLLEEIEHFFASYNRIKGEEFKPIGRHGPDRAEKLIEQGSRRFRQKKGKKD